MDDLVEINEFWEEKKGKTEYTFLEFTLCACYAWSNMTDHWHANQRSHLLGVFLWWCLALLLKHIFAFKVRDCDRVHSLGLLLQVRAWLQDLNLMVLNMLSYYFGVMSFKVHWGSTLLVIADPIVHLMTVKTFKAWQSLSKLLLEKDKKILTEWYSVKKCSKTPSIITLYIHTYRFTQRAQGATVRTLQLSARQPVTEVTESGHGLHNVCHGGSNVPQEHFANPHQRAAHRTQCHAPSHCRARKKVDTIMSSFINFY